MDEQARTITPSFIDTLFQDTWLLVLAIRNIPGVVVDKALYQHCLDMIEDVQDKLRNAGASDYLCDEFKFAHCVFLDEAIMTQKDVDTSYWWHASPLQSRLLMDLRGGEKFYVHLNKLLREVAPSEAILTCYHRMLTLGYQGKYQLDGGEANEERQSLLKQLNALLPAAKGKINTPIFIRNRRPDIRFWRCSPWVMRFIGLLLIAAASCAMSIHLHYLLGQWYTLS
ncbi:TPA: type VI secretion system protein TssL, short form [Klebsiella quasipneumoniae]|uniref:type VI secretion system protein TssL, short form n=1 Tax=Klebsiella pneumoniae complex TaxID=3390273 RepID=UPI000D595AAB|nr:type VI secretion system protein TssL, short form [Klebsiella pneumoniae]HBK4637193.1 type VI secretion system protein TssL, short form [Klebsiella michiganensis]HCM5257627.1 type VI secretion system protein TssL, short form [Klebsiella variicola subsp. variicola]HCM8037903.1 type VI secretion system protein TssL, short form [Klebsiella quasipneumoniae]HDS4139697.1 type VI secretion system protein TssL, short form [Klebsiella pneumoniae subsp. pneumoniae]HDU5540265.1 type VI secretion syste